MAFGAEGDDLEVSRRRVDDDLDRVGDLLQVVVRSQGWTTRLAVAELFVGWDDAVGPAVADHARPVAVEEGALVVRCDSTAWATQLGLMRSHLLTAIIERFPDAGVESLRILGPDVPTFKRGLRSVRGRGPRDTYG